MNISKKSWHFKVLKFCGIYPSTSLCGYFWQVALGAPLKVMFMALTCVVLAALSVIALFAVTLFPATLLFYAVSGLDPSQEWIVLGSVSLAIWLMAATEVTNNYRKKRRDLKPKDSFAIKKPNLFLLYLKAKKEKVCPLLTFTE
jgi:hypothetical protein